MTRAQAQSSRAWWVVDATGKPLGRLASEVASVLRGKHKPQYTPHEDTGDFVIVVNADKVALTGAKLDKKFYYHHSGIPGGFKAESYRHLLARKGTFPVEKAVRGMLPKGVLGRQMITKLKNLRDPRPSPRRSTTAAACHLGQGLRSLAMPRAPRQTVNHGHRQR